MPGRIQVSTDTAELIAKAGRSSWLVKRDTAVSPKGKGTMQTYWLEFDSAGSVKPSSTSSETDDTEHAGQVRAKRKV